LDKLSPTIHSRIPSKKGVPADDKNEIIAQSNSKESLEIVDFEKSLSGSNIPESSRS
jgi:hypothetical protein